MKYTAIILAAGNGSRMNLGYNKMFFSLKSIPLIALSTHIFLNDKNCTQIIIVVNDNEKKEIEIVLKKHDLLDDKCKIVNGSYERQYSVYNGLKNVTNDIVLVHDGARPFITNELVKKLVEEADKHGCAIPGVKVKDTIKYVENYFIKETLPRDFLYAVQTPQACKIELLRHTHKLAKEDNYLGTDEASLIEKYTTSKVKIVESNYENIKITTQEDLIYAEHLYDKYFI